MLLRRPLLKTTSTDPVAAFSCNLVNDTLFRTTVLLRFDSSTFSVAPQELRTSMDVLIGRVPIRRLLRANTSWFHSLDVSVPLLLPFEHDHTWTSWGYFVTTTDYYYFFVRTATSTRYDYYVLILRRQPLVDYYYKYFYYH